MSRYLLDSDVIIWHLRGRREVTAVLEKLQKSGLPVCSALSVLEVQVGVRRGEEEKTNLLFHALRVLDVDAEIAHRAARLIRDRRARGSTMDLADAVIAATCLVHDLLLVTYNQKHYAVDDLVFFPLPPLASYPRVSR